MASDQQLIQALKNVSRSFYLTLRILPASVRYQIGLAYLLARTADTIADTGLVPGRFKALEDFRAQLTAPRQSPLNFGELTGRQGSAAERALLENASHNIALLETLSPPDRKLVIEVLSTIISGQELDLRRFSGASENHVVALKTDDELDDYTFRVAGCVGDFWTRICRANIFPRARLDDSRLIENGVRFGKGLQLVNVLRDVSADLRLGRCYLPEEKLANLGLIPQDLLQTANEGRVRPLYDSYLDKAEAHLKAGWDYTTTLPRACVRLRLACAWPLLLGLETLRLLRSARVLDLQQRIKVPRTKLRQIILRSILLYPLKGQWESLAFPSK